MTKSLYAVLNVAPNADPAVIEAAYKALMKKYHPDVLAGEPSGDRQKAAEINEAFQVLKDPERRARYDGDQRARQDAIRRVAVAAVNQPVYHPPRPRRRRPRWPLLVLLAAVAAATIFWLRDPEAARDLLASQLHTLAPKASAATGQAAAVQVEDIDRALEEYQKIKGKAGLLGLTAFSQDCFADQSRVPTARAFDFCVAFDHAAARYGEKIAGDDLPQLQRFEPRELEIRHESAARLVSDSDRWIAARRARLRELTFQRLELSEPSAPQAAQIVQASTVQAARPLPRRGSLHRVRHRHSSTRRARGADGDFLEREGYIY